MNVIMHCKIVAKVFLYLSGGNYIHFEQSLPILNKVYNFEVVKIKGETNKELRIESWDGENIK